MAEYRYVSPLLIEWDESRLSINLLAELLPQVREGETAKELLAKNSGRRGDKRVKELEKQVKDGEIAKEKLFVAALPLIRLIATKEWRRRQQWSSKVSVEDLIQEATVGFLKGLSSFNLDAMRNSSTNYLGQWMLVEVRRAAESLDHDMQVGHEAGERFRKIRAIRSRLIGELGREPTNEEIAEASKDASYSTQGNKLGRVNSTGGPKGVTAEQVAEEKNARGRVGHVSRFAEIDDDDSSGGGWQVDISRVSSSTPSTSEGYDKDPAETVTDMALSAAFSELLEELFTKLNLGEEQRLIVSMRYGIAPHPSAMSARKISQTTGVHRERVSRILMAFSAEMTLRNGRFHEILWNMNEDDVEAIHMSGILAQLGEWDPHAAVDPVPHILTDSKLNEEHPPPPVHTEAEGVIAWFECSFHGRKFSGMYPSRRNVPKRRACPACNRPCDLISIVVATP